MKKYDVVALGELLIDFTENGKSNQGNPLFEANPGGAPCNVFHHFSPGLKFSSYQFSVIHSIIEIHLCPGIRYFYIGLSFIYIKHLYRKPFFFYDRFDLVLMPGRTCLNNQKQRTNYYWQYYISYHTYATIFFEDTKIHKQKSQQGKYLLSISHHHYIY